MFFSFAPEFHCFTAVWITLQQSISERDPSEYEPKADWWLQRMLHSFHRDAACFEGTISHTYAIMECHTFNIIYIYTYCIVYIRAFWFEIVISNSVRLYLLRSFPRDAALFCASCSTRTHNILFKEYHALRTTTIVQKSDIAYIRGFLFEMGEAFYSNAIPAFFCMLVYVEGLSTSNIELLWRILAEQRHVLVTSMYRCIPATSWNQEPRLQTTLLLLVLVVNARPHICWTMPHASYITYCASHSTWMHLYLQCDYDLICFLKHFITISYYIIIFYIYDMILCLHVMQKNVAFHSRSQVLLRLRYLAGLLKADAH